MYGFYFPVEQAILADWMGLQRPDQARGIRVDHPGALRALAAVYPRAVRPRCQADGDFGAFTLANAAGRVALAGVPLRLSVAQAPPIFGGSGEGPATEVELAPAPPRALLEVDWAHGAGHRFEPERYLLCDLPGFGARAVVAVRESAAAYGYGVVAAGWFPATAPPLEGAGRVLVAWWRLLACQGQARWDAVLAEGLADEAQAAAWAAQVWADEPRSAGRSA